MEELINRLKRYSEQCIAERIDPDFAAAIIEAINVLSLCQMLGAKPEQQRISVKEWLPFSEYGESKSVLTIDELGCMRVAYFDGGCWCHPTGELIETTVKFKITHWMPLPEPPKEETDA